MSARMDELARAYAVLGLRRGATSAELRTRYRALVRQWHPDRLGFDPQGQAEAAVRMREINGAYRRLAADLASRESEVRVPPPAHPAGGRLSREEIDSAVRALGSDGPVDWFLGLFAWKGDWDWRDTTVSWRSISPYLAYAIALSVGGSVDSKGIAPQHPFLVPWVVLAAFAVSAPLLWALLPKK